ncbi:MAG: tyrosine-type recombinase/integrase [Rhodospirillales bacterium]|nr:tyrosine-type recombinase/integrase [Rhodospirillales bacterium]
MARITKKAVDALLARPREYMLWDDCIKGFGVRVHPSGRKVYLVKFRNHGRVIKRTIGPHGTISTAAARARAAEIVTAARTGRDLKGRIVPPQMEPAATMRDLAKRFLEEYVPIHCKPSSAHSYEIAIRQHVLGRLGNRRVVDVTRGDVVALHHRMRETPYAANRTIGILSAMFTVAELWELRPQGSNPCRYVKRFRERKRERFLSDDEYRRLGAALRDAESTGTEAAAAIAAIRLLMLTGCRLSEIMNLRWTDVALHAAELRLRDSKTGAKVVHLGAPAVEVLRRIARVNGNPWVIVGRRPGSRLASLQFPWGRIRKRAGLDDVRLHDLRHSFASGGLLVGEGLPMIGRLLGHVQVQTTARYAHLADDPVKAAADRIAGRIAKVVD